MVLPHFILFFFNDTATTEIYTLSLHDALPISWKAARVLNGEDNRPSPAPAPSLMNQMMPERVRLTVAVRSEEHTSELQSHLNLVCRLLLVKKKRHPTLPNTTDS